MNIINYYIKLLKHFSTINYEPFKEVNFKKSILAFYSQDALSLLVLLKDLEKLNLQKGDIVLLNDGSKTYHSLIKAARKTNIKIYTIDREKKARETYKDLIDLAMNNFLVYCLDGTTKKRGVPNKLLFRLSNATNKPITLVRINYRHKLKLKNRFDNLAIPLLGSTIDINFSNIGVTNTDFIHDFCFDKNEFKKLINEKDKNNW